MAPKNLPDADVQSALARLAGWTREGDALVRTVSFKSFPDAVAFVTRVADVAEELDHHPDIDVRYTQVRLACSTHVTKGITERDVVLATRIDALL